MAACAWWTRLCPVLPIMTLHCFDNKLPFSKESLEKIAQLKAVYGLDLDASDSHNLRESAQEPGKQTGRKK